MTIFIIEIQLLARWHLYIGTIYGCGWSNSYSVWKGSGPVHKWFMSWAVNLQVHVRYQGSVSILRPSFPGKGIPILKIRWLREHLIFNMGIPILVRRHLYIETDPWLYINILRLRQYGCHFADDIFRCIFLNQNVWFLIKIPLKFVPKGLINNIPALVHIWLGTVQATVHYLNQWRLIYWGIYVSLGLNELTHLPLNKMGLTDDKLTLVQVMVWCSQATSQYLSQGWRRFMSPYGVIRSQWVDYKLINHLWNQF